MRSNVLTPGVKVDLYGPSLEGIGFGMIRNLNGSTPGAGTPPLRSMSAAATYKALTNPGK